MAIVLAPNVESDEEMQRLYNWVDDIPLSRAKRNIGRDFSDGVLLAEIIHHYFPTKVEVHNYSAANSVSQKEYNFRTMNQKVLKRLGFQLHPNDIRDVTQCQAGAIEKVLALFRSQIAKCKAREANSVYEREPGDVEVAGRENGKSHHQPVHSISVPIVPASKEEAKKHDPPVAAADPDILIEKEQTIHELRETIMIMTEKIKKLEQLVRIKDSKIQTLTQKLMHK